MVPYRSEFKINQSGTTSEYFDPLQTHNTRHTLTHFAWNAQIKKNENLSAQIVGDLMLLTTEAVLHIRTKLLGSMWSKTDFLCISPKTSFTTTYQQHIQFYRGANCLPSHKCGNPNSSATTVH